MGEHDTIKCPFCGEEEDWDLIGFKGHLLTWCEAFEATMTPDEEMRRRRVRATVTEGGADAS